MRQIKNICFAYITPFHPFKGGIGKVTHTLTLEFQKRGYNVFYLIYRSGITIEHEYDYPAPLEYLPKGGDTEPHVIDAYKDFLKRNNIDVVINQSGNFSDSRLWVKAAELGIPVISTLHSGPMVAYPHYWSSDIWPLKGTGLMAHVKRIARMALYPKLHRELYNKRVEHFKQLLPLTDRLVSLTQADAEVVKNITPEHSAKISAINNPNAYLNYEPDWTKKEKIILFVGLFGSAKREDDMLRIWARICRLHPDWKLVMVGSGNPSRMKLIKKIAKKCINVELPGIVDALPYQKKASIIAMTSRYEGWGMVLTEGMQQGCVPVLYNSYDAAKVIISKSGKDGFLVKPFNRKEFANRLEQLMDNQELRESMAHNAVESVKRFDVSIIADQWEALFKTL